MIIKNSVLEHSYLKGEKSQFSNSFGKENSTMYEEMSNFENHNKILLIEDNPGDARLVELLLAESDLLNCKITHKTTLTDGIRALEEDDDFAAILLDLTLPDSRGFETLEQLVNRFPDHNVIVLTGLSDKTLGINAVRAGAQDFLIKGAFDADLLAKSLRYSIERSSVLKRLEETQRLSHIGNWEYIPDTKEFIASSEVYKIFGQPAQKQSVQPEELLAMDSGFQIFEDIHNKTLAEKELKQDYKIQLSNGNSRYVFIHCRINKNAESRLVLNGIIQDITERKLAEQELMKSRERYQDIFTKSKDAIYICTLEGKLLDFNQATEELFGYSKEELIDHPNIHDIYEPFSSKNSFLSAIKAKEAVKDFEIEIVRKDESTRYCMITANFLETDDFTGYNAIIRDITERKQADELRKARDLARQSSKMKEQFIASISHEMRTPMNAILGMSNLLIRTELNEEQKNYIGNVKQSSEILLGIINDILEISTIQNGKLAFEDKDFDLYQVLNNLVNVMQYKIKEKDLEFKLEIDPSVPKIVVGDKLRLNQVLFNLVGNAVKFTDSGHVKIVVKNLSETDNSVQLYFEVEDSGIGIPQDKLDAIFETFTRIRTKERLYEGTGLGLSIAKNLVNQQGGKIGVKSDFGKGSLFFFDMIFQKGDASNIVAPSTPKDQEQAVDADMDIDLLLVEDHKMNQIVARKTLERQWSNIKITIANNGQEAVDILKTQTFHIILMDISMPIMDGYEATQHIRNNMPEHIANIPILAMTAHAHISKDNKFKEYGMDDFVLKPFEPKQLFDKITQYTKKGRHGS